MKKESAHTPKDLVPFLEWYSAQRERVTGVAPAAATIRAKRVALSVVSKQNGCQTIEDVARLLADRDSTELVLRRVRDGRSSGTARTHVYALLDLARYALARGWVDAIAIQPEDVPPKNVGRPIVVLTDDERERIVSAARGGGLRWWAFVSTLSETGRRANEVLGLEWSWLKLEADRPHFVLPTTKAGRPQYVPLSRRLREEVFTPENVAILKAGGGGSNTRARGDCAVHVFPFSYHPASERMARLYDACGVQAKGLHVWRHSFATSKLRAGVPIHAVSRLLGHASTSTTERAYNWSTALDFADYLDPDEP
jgi:integrase